MAKIESTSFDRRDFLKAATGGVAALAAGSALADMPALGAQQPAANASGAPDKLRIDIHGHIFLRNRRHYHWDGHTIAASSGCLCTAAFAAQIRKNAD